MPRSLLVFTGERTFVERRSSKIWGKKQLVSFFRLGGIESVKLSGAISNSTDIENI